MRQFLRRICIRLASKLADPQGQEFEEGFAGVPSADELSEMSTFSLAQNLANHKSGTPAYILVEHELTLKIAKLQAKATLSSGWIGAIGAILAAAVGYLFGHVVTC